MAFSQDIIARLGLDNSAFNKGLRSTRDRARSFATSMGGILAGIGFAEVTRRTLEWASELRRTASQAGVTVEQLQRLQGAAKNFNVEAETINDVLEEFSIRIGDAIEGGANPAAEAFKTLKVDLFDANDQLRSTRDLFGEVTTALSNIEERALRVQLADKIFGGQAGQALRFLEQGNEQIQQLAENVDIVSSENVNKLDRVNQIIKTTGRELFKTGATILGNVIPPFEKFFKIVGDFVRSSPLGFLGSFISSLTGGAGVVQSLRIAGEETMKNLGRIFSGETFDVESDIAKKANEALENQKETREEILDNIKKQFRESQKQNDQEEKRLEQLKSQKEQLRQMRKERAGIRAEMRKEDLRRTQFSSVSELAGSNLRAARFFGAPEQFFEDVQRARQVRQLQQRAQSAKSVGRLATAGQLFGRADEIRKDILALTPSARDPQKVQRDQLASLNRQIDQLQGIVDNTKPLANASVE